MKNDLLFDSSQNSVHTGLCMKWELQEVETLPSAYEFFLPRMTARYVAVQSSIFLLLNVCSHRAQALVQDLTKALYADVAQ